MVLKNLASHTAAQLTQLMADREISTRDVMESVLSRIDQVESDIQAFLTLRDRSELLSEADKVDLRRRNGEAIGLLGGLPIAVKDSICTNGLRTTCASKMLSTFVPPYDATVVEKVKRADGIIIGKTNMDEFSMGSTTENSAYQVTRNPVNPEYVPGGTSGGSAAAVAAGESVLALGVDTGGSVRQPASFCGIVGIKPTYGRVSRYGVISYGSSLDQVGAFARDVQDASLLMRVISGHDPRDSTSAPLGVPEYDHAPQGKSPLTIGFPAEYFGPGLDPEIRQQISECLRLLASSGHKVVDISLPHTRYAVAAYYIIACSEASANLARYSGTLFGYRGADQETIDNMYCSSRSEGFGPEVRRRILLGTYSLSAGYYDAYYMKASRVRELLKRDFQEAFKTCDLIVHPITPEPAFKLGEKKCDDPLVMYLVDIYSVTANMAGLPALSLPCGRTKRGLPIGVQLTGKHFDESTVLGAAKQLESLLASTDKSAKEL